jgi:hypothetical protein
MVQPNSDALSLRTGVVALRNHRTDLLLLTVLVVLTAFVYESVRTHQFIAFDDATYVSDNPHVRAGLTPSSIHWALTTLKSGNWIPLTWLAHQLDVTLWGVDSRSMALSNAFMHGLNVVLLFVLLKRAAGSRWRSAFAAAVFAVHPLNVESVAWISERKNTLSLFFALCMMLAYVSYARRPGVAKYLLVLLLFVMGLMSKSVLMTFPFVLLLLDVWPLHRVDVRALWRLNGEDRKRIGRLVLEKIPLIALSAGCGLLTIVSQKSEGGISIQATLPLGLRLSNAVVSYGQYLRRFVWPDDLAVFYPYVFEHTGRSVAGSVVVLLLITIVALRTMHKWPWIACGWFWFVGVLFPMVGVVQVGSQAMADRYFYHAGIGLIIAGVWTVGAFVLHATGPSKRHAGLGMGGVVAGLCIVTWSSMARSYVRVWERNDTLFAHALLVTENNWLAMSVLGADLLSKGRLIEAEGLILQGLRINPLDARLHMDMGEVYRRTGRLDNARLHLQRALELEPASKTTRERLELLGTR